jgi:anti-sigma B factor antagonist
MNWSSKTIGSALVGMPVGRVDETSWESFNTAATGAVGQAALAGLPLVLDLAGIEYMSSRGLRALTLVKREAEAQKVPLTLARPNERMREILAISRYDKIFTITAGLEG